MMGDNYCFGERLRTHLMKSAQPQMIASAVDISTQVTYYLVYLFLRERDSLDPKRAGWQAIR
jgi:hypothetical protein